MALSTNRKTMDGDKEFEMLKTKLLQAPTMNTTTSINTTTTLSAGAATARCSLNEGYFAQPQCAATGCLPLLVAGGFLYAFARYSASMDVYEKGILLGAIPAIIAMGWFWRPLRAADAGRRRLCAAGHHVLPGRPGAGRAGVLAQVFPVQPVGHPVDERAVLHEHDVLLARHVRQQHAEQRRIEPSATLESLGSKIAWVASAWR